MKTASIFDTSPNGNGIPPNDGRMSMRDWLEAQDKIPKENPDNTPDDERVKLVVKFKREAEESETRIEAVSRWQTVDRFIDGEQWSQSDLAKLDPHQ